MSIVNLLDIGLTFIVLVRFTPAEKKIDYRLLALNIEILVETYAHV